MANTDPAFGEKTRLYPCGYGYCQCGCGQTTPQTVSGNYAMFLREHIASVAPPDSNRPRAKFQIEIPNGDPRDRSLRGQPDAGYSDVNLLQRPKKFSSPDQALLDEYTGVALKYAELRRELQILRMEMGSAMKLLDELWVDGGELKAIVVERLRLALSRLDSYK